MKRGGDIFRFKHFDVTNAADGMRVGTDGVLLGVFAPVDHLADGDQVWDLGSGTGVVSLLIAQRTAGRNVTITGVELLPQAAALCAANFAASPWADRLHCECADASTWHGGASPKLIVSNPPYFAGGAKAPETARALARHADTLGPTQVLQVAADNLAPDGRVCMIVPCDGAEDIIAHGVMLRLALVGRHDFVAREGRDPSRCILTFMRRPCHIVPEHSSMNIRGAEGRYTPEYLGIMLDYYHHLTS